MKISVALATFNGERFLREQLAGFIAQTRPPDQVVAVDDGSSDGTRSILQDFAAEAHFPVTVVPSDTNRGVTAAFETAIRRCSGDLVLLSDQDDRWRMEKIERIAEVFSGDSRLDCLFTDAELIDDRGEVLGVRLWDFIGFTAAERGRVAGGEALEVLSARNVATGATMAFRRAAVERVLPIPAGLLHDRWIAIALAAAGRISLLDEALIDYRRHEGQLAGAGADVRRLATRIEWVRATGPEAFRDRAEELEKIAAGLRRIAEVDSHRLRPIDERAAHLRARGTLPARVGARVFAVLREATSLRYHRYSSGLRSIAKDIIWSGGGTSREE